MGGGGGAAGAETPDILSLASPSTLPEVVDDCAMVTLANGLLCGYPCAARDTIGRCSTGSGMDGTGDDGLAGRESELDEPARFGA